MSERTGGGVLRTVWGLDANYVLIARMGYLGDYAGVFEIDRVPVLKLPQCVFLFQIEYVHRLEQGPPYVRPYRYSLALG